MKENKTMTNQIFNFRRFSLCLKKELYENKKQLLLTTLSIYLGLVFLMIMGNLIFLLQPLIDVARFVVIAMFGFVASVSASLMFGKLKNKETRIEHFMSPASATEKFAVQLVIYLVCFVVVFFMCAQLADATRFAIMSILNDTDRIPGLITFIPGTFSFAEEFANIWFDGFNMNLFTGGLLTLSTACSFSTYMFGSVLWPKLSFLKTFAACYAVQSVVGLMLLALFKLFGYGNIVSCIVAHHEVFVWLIYAIYVLLIVAFSIGTYLLYKRKDVIKNTLL